MGKARFNTVESEAIPTERFNNYFKTGKPLRDHELIPSQRDRSRYARESISSQSESEMDE
jgi:hypothetical protein